MKIKYEKTIVENVSSGMSCGRKPTFIKSSRYHYDGTMDQKSNLENLIVVSAYHISELL